VTSLTGYTLSMLRQKVAAHDVIAVAILDPARNWDERARITRERDFVRADIVALGRQYLDEVDG
jgi:hypothetical protein